MTPPRMRPTRTAFAALTLAALASTVLPAPGARADHTPLPGSVALVGTLQSELGCPGDWQPECAATDLAPVPGQPGLFRGTFTVPAGSYEYKVALNDGWTENYGAGGAAGGANLTLTAPGGQVTFTYDHRSHVISDSAPRSVTAEQAAQWVRRDVIALPLPAQRAGLRYRLHWSADADLARNGNTVTGGQSVALELDQRGLSAAVLRQFPQLAGYGALRVPAGLRGQIRSILTAQLAVSVTDANGALVSATGVQLPGVLDDVYAGAQQRRLGPTWQNGRPSLQLWAPTAQRARLLLDPAGAAPQRAVTMKRDADGVWTPGLPLLGRGPLPVRGHRLRPGGPGHRGEQGDRPVLGRADHQLHPVGAGRPEQSFAEAGWLGAPGEAGAAEAGEFDDL